MKTCILILLLIVSVCSFGQSKKTIANPEVLSCEGFSSEKDCSEARNLIYQQEQNKKHKSTVIQNSYDICEMDPENEVCEKEKEGKNE